MSTSSDPAPNAQLSPAYYGLSFGGTRRLSLSERHGVFDEHQFQSDYLCLGVFQFSSSFAEEKSETSPPPAYGEIIAGTWTSNTDRHQSSISSTDSKWDADFGQTSSLIETTTKWESKTMTHKRDPSISSSEDQELAGSSVTSHKSRSSRSSRSASRREEFMDSWNNGDFHKIEEERGFLLVTEVVSGSQAHQAGVRRYDIFTNFGPYHAGNFPGLGELAKFVSMMVDQEIQCKIIRVRPNRGPAKRETVLVPVRWEGGVVLRLVVDMYEKVTEAYQSGIHRICPCVSCKVVLSLEKDKSSEEIAGARIPLPSSMIRQKDSSSKGQRSNKEEDNQKLICSARK